MTHFLLRFFCLLALSTALPAAEAVSPVLQVPRVFSDHAVLQKGPRTPVFGWGVPGETVTAALAGSAAEPRTSTVGKDGRWQVELDLSNTGEGPFRLEISSPGARVVLEDILVGEVWLFSGQSNMRFHLSRSTGGQEDAAQAADPQLRLLSVGLKVSETPVYDFKERWAAATPETAGTFSAVGYYVGRELRKSVKGPIGLVSISWAGTTIEAWMSRAALAGDPDFQPILQKWNQREAEYPAKKAEWDATKETRLAAWEVEAAKAKAEGKPEPLKPGPPPAGPDSLDRPSGLYHGEILAFAPYAIRGVVWYQGEQNSGRGFQYRKLLPALIADWRKLWGAEEMPFVIIGMPNYGKPQADPRFSLWAELREAQALADRNVPGTELVVTIDLGEDADVHPKDKKSVGLRAARIMEKEIYKLPSMKEVEVFGPTCRGMDMEGDAARIRLAHAEGLKTRDGGKVAGIAIAGADRTFVWADAEIQGTDLVVRSEKVRSPVAVRYNWADAPHGNLVNAAGLPAAPFRTDDFPAQTRDVK